MLLSSAFGDLYDLSRNSVAARQLRELCRSANPNSGTYTSHDVRSLVCRRPKLRSGLKRRTASAVFFERDKKAREAILRIPIAGKVFEFPLSI